jgi:hypothetical protein
MWMLCYRVRVAVSAFSKVRLPGRRKRVLLIMSSARF